jgi:hypothetical protein
MSEEEKEMNQSISHIWACESLLYWCLMCHV